MKVFISHPIADEDLATQLKEVLEQSEEIEIAYIAQRVKKYDMEISNKIIQQIDDSDYLIAIITNDSISSASVNQELGYAQGISMPKIPMIEIGAKKGFLIYGKDVEEFSRNNFKDICNKILNHILEKGPIKKKLSKEEEENYYYKIELLHDLQGICHAVFYAISQLYVQSRPNYRNESELTTILNELMKDYEYWKSKIELINSNNYIPALIRSKVKQLLHQGIKPISFPAIPPEFRFVENTFINPLKHLFEEDYFTNDVNLEIQKQIKELLDYIPMINDLKNQESFSELSELKQVIDTQEKSRKEYEKMIYEKLIGRLGFLKLSFYERKKFEEAISKNSQPNQKQIHIDTRTSKALTDIEQITKDNASTIQVDVLSLLESILMYGKILNENERWTRNQIQIFEETQKEINRTISKLTKKHPYKLNQPYSQNPDWI